MAALSDYLEDDILDHYLRNQAAATVATVYAALYVDAGPGEAGAASLNEVRVPGNDGYARVAVTFNAASAGSADNSGAIVFGPATTNDWDDITYIGLVDASTAGNVLFYKQLDSSQTVPVGDSMTIGAGNLIVTLD